MLESIKIFFSNCTPMGPEHLTKTSEEDVILILPTFSPPTISDLHDHVQQRPDSAVYGAGHHGGLLRLQAVEHQDSAVRVLKQEPG